LRTKGFILLLLIWIILFAGKDKTIIFKNIPYGTIRLTDSLYIDKQPIKVRDYLEFLNDIRNSYTPVFHDSISKMQLFNLPSEIGYHLYDSLPMDSNFYQRMITRTWQTVGNEKHIYATDYRLLSAKHYNYPIVNVNYYQIYEFCRWRTDKVKLHYAVENKTLRQRKKYPIDFEYRIIKRKEWEKAMGTFFEDIGKLKTIESSSELLNLAKPYPSSKKFTYNSRNAAEYLEDDIITIGFNWIDEAGMGDVSYMAFEKPTDWVTFRCMCEIKTDTVNIKPEVNIQQHNVIQYFSQEDITQEEEKDVKGIKAEKAKKKRKRKR